MGNITNDNNWAAQKRLRWIEFLLWWRGWIGRNDLLETFGISAAQASSDLQRYAELNPTAMIYQTSRKRYESVEKMKCHWLRPDFEEAIKVFFGGSGLDQEVARTTLGARRGSAELAWNLWTPGWLSRMEMPRQAWNPYCRSGMQAPSTWVERSSDERWSGWLPPKVRVDVEVARRILMAILGDLELRIRYASVHSNDEEWRVIAPRAVAWDGHRWHVRAGCRKREAWRDFVIGRIAKADWPVPLGSELPVDQDWQTIETVKLKLHPSLGEAQRESLRMDYGIADDTLELSVRRAMKPYWLASLLVEDAAETEEIPKHFVIERPDAELDLF